MSMILSLAAVSDATIDRLHGHPALVWRVIAPDDAEALAAAVATQPGWLARLFGRAAAAPLPTLDLADGEGEMIDIDKAWHGIHYLLTGTAWEGEPPLNFLASGGREVGNVDVGYGPARTLTAAETQQIAGALARLDDESLRTRFAPAEMTKLEIYPEIWDRDPAEDDALGYLMEYLSELRGAVNTASAQGLGLLITIT
jgi:hypothetical protein